MSQMGAVKRGPNIGDLLDLRIERRGGCDFVLVAGLSPEAEADPVRLEAAMGELEVVAEAIAKIAVGEHLKSLDSRVCR